MARARTAPLILAMLVAATAGADRAAHGEDCLGGPNKPSPAGTHWFYRIDRATHRKCWYLGDANRHRAPAAQSRAGRRSVAAPPEPEEEAAAPPQGPARETAPDPGIGTRWPQTAATAGVFGPGGTPAPRAEPERAPAAATVMAERAGTRVVTTERVRSEPAPAKPQEAAKPPAAAPVPAAASDARALPGTLLGVALLLAAVGAMLVLGRRRLIAAHGVYVARGAEESAPRPSPRARRSLREILTQAQDGEPYDAAAHETRFFDRIRRGWDASAPGPDEREAHGPGEGERNPQLPAEPDSRIPLPRSMRATLTPDIAAATLQPAIDPLPPEPIAPAPDVEQSLRQLLDAWERLAA